MRRLVTLAAVIAAAALTAAGQLSITTESLNVAVVGQPYTPVAMTTSGDPGPLVWSFVSPGGPPFGFVIGPGPVGGPPTTGTFCYGTVSSGNPPNCTSNGVIGPAGVYSVTIQASSLSTSQTATVQYSLAVVGALQIDSTPPPNAFANQAYSYSIPVSGGTGQFLWSLLGGQLPPGIGLDSFKGALVGTAPAVNAAYPFTVQVLDQVTGFTASQSFVLNVVGGLAILTTSLPDATVNQPYTPIQLQATGSPILVWSVPSGWQLPPGLTLSTSGLLSGTGLQIGQYQFAIQVANPQVTGLVTSQIFTLLVTLGPLSIKEQTLPTATQNIPYLFTLTPLGGIPPYNWSFDVPNQQGMSIGVNTGVISGTPTKAGVITLPVTLKDSVGRAFSTSYALNVGNGVSITTTSLANSPPGLQYSDKLTATGGVLTYQWGVVGGTFPPGLTLHTATGVIDGIPTTQGVFQFTVQVLDFVGGTDRKTFSITIGPVLAITTISLPDGALGGVPYSQTLIAENGTPAYTWSIASGALPPGLQLDGTTGIISGTPTTAGTFTFDVQVNDNARGVAHRNLTIRIPLLITNGDLSGVVLTTFSQTLTATGGNRPYTWSSGTLPVGLQLNSATGVISGTPGVGGTSPVAFTVTDVNGLTGTKTVNITILQPPAPATSIGLSTATQPAVSLTTGAPYASEITGFLTLKFTPLAGVVGTDDMVRFAPDGSTKLQYIVRANATQAIFPTISTGTPALITGTVAGTITLTASMSAGGQDITPSPAPTKTITIDPAVPVISAVVLQQVTGGLNVVVTGYSNTREISSGSFTFAVSSGNTLSQAQITVQLTSAYAAWFGSTTSNATGGQFKLTVPFSVTQGAATAITKVGVTLTNSKGASAAVSSP